MPSTGCYFIGQRPVSNGTTFHAVNPVTGESLEPEISAATLADVEAACELAWEASKPYQQIDYERRAVFLEAIADEIMGLGDELLHRGSAETGLPLIRLTGERGRTVGQLRLFASEIRAGAWLGVRIDPALPDREPLPRPDLRQRKVALGPVAVFGASNFPLAFSVAGGDTAAALAAGCPVIVKGHSAHPGTGELVAQAILTAAQSTNMPDGVFSFLQADSHEVGGALVANPRVQAVGFTGSRAGGLALWRIANARPVPIPVYAEMSSVNPVLLLPTALDARAEALGEAFIGSLTLGAGQFCTNPGLVLALDSAALDRFLDTASRTLQATPPATMLTAHISSAYTNGVDALAANDNVELLARGEVANGTNCERAALFSIRGAELAGNPEVLEEVFGAAGIVVRCCDDTELLGVVERLEGQLTATMHMDEADTDFARRCLPILERKAGRVVVNGWPTGVDVCHAMVHGGPFPATSDGRSTSVGTLAIERFLRPVCYQDLPLGLLPDELRGDGSGLPRRYDGAFLTS